MSSYTALGLMSGSSLDGLDICCAEFSGDITTDIWSYRILKAVTCPYPPEWSERLANAASLNGLDLIKLDIEYGHFLGKMVEAFLEEHELHVDLVASHGHTVFHQPDHGFTFQAGDGETLVTHLAVPLVSNFRNKDVALGGQGAPLVTVGEKYLFSQYDICLNLGGISNISINDKGFDVCHCNIGLNNLAQRNDPSSEYDQDGRLAASGKIVQDVLDKLNALDFYQQEPPKSLGKESFDENIAPLLDVQSYQILDLMRTFVEHICMQITDTLIKELGDVTPVSRQMIVTGGGAMNSYLMERLRNKIKEKCLNIVVIESDEDTINFKEALLFAFLGLRALLGLPNISNKVTGARCESVSGGIHLPPTTEPLNSPRMGQYSFHFRRASHSHDVMPGNFASGGWNPASGMACNGMSSNNNPKQK